MKTSPCGSHQLDARCHGLGVLTCVALMFQVGCATSAPGWSSQWPSGSGFSSIYRVRRPTPAKKLGTREGETNNGGKLALEGQTAEEGRHAAVAGTVGNGGTALPEGNGSRAHRPAAQARDADPLDESGESPFGWPDGVGDGRPWAVPMSLDYFQGFLVQAGVPWDELPEDGRTLSPKQALELLTHLQDTPATYGNYGPQRMAAHLLLEVATGGEVVPRAELHARMRRFARLLVARTDGYLVKPTTGRPVQKVGELELAGDGSLRAGRYEVGPFYAIAGEYLFPVNGRLEVPPGARAVGLYEPDDGVVAPVAEGAMLAVTDTVEGLYRLAFHPGETLEGLARLPETMRLLYQNAPELWEAFRHRPYAEQVRALSRITTNMLLVVGTSGAGALKTASWGEKLGRVTVPLLSLTPEGALALRLVAVPAGTAVTAAGQVVSSTYVLHMASVGATGMGGGGGWVPPTAGPGKWVQANESMSLAALKYQCQISGAPPGWVYRVCHEGVCVDFDGYSPGDGFLLDAKAFNYAKHFDHKLEPRGYYQGADKLVEAAQRQLDVANSALIRWHVAEPKMVPILKKLFLERKVNGIEVVCTPPLP